NQSRRRELDRVEELMPRQHLIAAADAVDRETKACARRVLAIEADAGGTVAEEAIAVRRRLIIAVEEETNAIGEAGGRTHRIAAFKVRLAKSDLRYEAAVGAEAVAEIALLDHPVVMTRRPRPPHVAGVAVERLSVPFIREVGPIGSFRIAEEKLPGHGVLVIRTPLKIRAEDAI